MAVREDLKLYRLKLSTNVERVALALAHKGLEVESVWVPYGERSKVRAVSGQDLVPVLVHGDRVIIDSMNIVSYLEERFPGRPSLYPAEPARRAGCVIFVEWFNQVWKVPPNQLESELSKPIPEQDPARVERLGRQMQSYLDRFEQMLTGRDYLLGEFGAADVAAYPFIRYAKGAEPDDPYLYHEILVKYQQPGEDHPRLLDWLSRMAKRPQA